MMVECESKIVFVGLAAVYTPGSALKWKKSKQIGQGEWRNSIPKNVEELFHTREGHTLNISWAWSNYLSSQGIRGVKTGLFYKSNNVCFMDRWFIFDAMEHWTVPR